MKLYLGIMVILLLVVSYYSSLCLTTDAVMHQLADIHHTYSAVSDTTDKWQQGDLSAGFNITR